jgi:hypothetical protein
MTEVWSKTGGKAKPVKLLYPMRIRSITMYQGGCLCGTVRFEVHGPIRNIVYCHCSQCRKAQGSAFATNGVVEASDLHFVAGEDNLSRFAQSPDQARYFCQSCGSPIYSESTARPHLRRIRLGTLESAIEERPMAHIFASSKADWEEICGDLPQYDAYEPGRDKL